MTEEILGDSQTAGHLGVQKPRLEALQQVGNQEASEWKQLDHFGNGIIYGRGNERKIVTPGMTDFSYEVKPLTN